MSEGGVAWERKRGGGVLSYFSFLRRTKGRENDEGISCCPFPALRLCFFLTHFLLFLISFCISLCHLFLLPRSRVFFCLFCSDNLFVCLHISLFHFGSALFTHDVCEFGSFPFWIWQWEETLVPSHALIFCVD